MPGRPRKRIREVERIQEIVEPLAAFIVDTAPERSRLPDVRLDPQRDRTGVLWHGVVDSAMALTVRLNWLLDHLREQIECASRPFPTLKLSTDDGRHDQDARTDARGGHADSAGDAIAAPDAPEVVPDRDRAPESPGTRSVRDQLVDLIRRKSGSVTIRDILRSSRLFKNADDAMAELDAMVQAGLGGWTHTTPGVKGGKPSRRFQLVDTTPTETPVDTVGVDNTPADEA